MISANKGGSLMKKMIDPETGQVVLVVPVYTRKEYVGRKYICERLGVDNSNLNHCPWNLPDFGKAIRGRRDVKPYLKNEVDEWLAIPAKERKRRYMEAMSETD